MRKIRLLVELEYNNEIMHGENEDAIMWFYETILKEPLILHSNELGDEVGIVRVLRIEDDNCFTNCF